MKTHARLPDDLEDLRGRILVVEAERGSARRELLTAWAERLRSQGSRTLVLACDFRDGGVWAGVDAWVAGLLPRLERDAPELVKKHAFTLSVVLPHGRVLHAGGETLTDEAEGGEAVRNYAMDRAYRVPHGVVDLMDDWYSQAPPAPAVLMCDGYDRAGALCRRFFRELARRRGAKLGIALVLVVDPAGADEAIAELPLRVPVSRVRLHLAADPESVTPEMEAFGRTVEEGVRARQFLPERRFPELLRYWEEMGQPASALPWMAYALGRFNHYGFYEDALLFLEPVLQGIDLIPEDREYLTRWNVVGALFNCLIAVGQVERAYRVVREQGLARITDPLDRSRACYVAAMVHARFLPAKDFDRAERYLQEGMRELENADAEDENRDFMAVFLFNGLAYIRSRQGKPREAIELCSTGFDRMRARLGSHKHRLHRSVLLYNIAQVYTATREHDAAVEYYTAALEMDPNYSEYYNERGNSFLALGRFDEAIVDYREAIRLSAPYQEVWTNLGQCYRRMGKAQEALEAYSRGLDLQPEAELARVGRAQALTAVGRTAEARADYLAALEVNPAQPSVLANLAVLHYRGGDVDGALSMLNQAVALAPDNADLYRNRAVALEGVGRPKDAASDLARYLSLVPGAPDRAAVKEKIATLREALVAV